MARIDPVAVDEVTPELREVYRTTSSVLGKTSTFFQTVAHRPKILRDLVTFSLHFLRNDEDAVLDLKTKWRVILRTASRNQCQY